MYVGADGKELLEAVIENEYKPTKKSEERLRAISDKITKQSNETILRNQKDFILLYGQDLFDFIISISNPKHTLWLGMYPHNFRWEVKWDSDTEDYWVIRFREGVFNYVIEECSGYAGVEILEKNISKERVLELLKKEL